MLAGEAGAGAHGLIHFLPPPMRPCTHSISAISIQLYFQTVGCHSPAVFSTPRSLLDLGQLSRTLLANQAKNGPCCPACRRQTCKNAVDAILLDPLVSMQLRRACALTPVGAGSFVDRRNMRGRVSCAPSHSQSTECTFVCNVAPLVAPALHHPKRQTGQSFHQACTESVGYCGAQ